MKQALLLLLLPLLAFTDTWQPFAIDSHVTVQLPRQPIELDATKLTTNSKLHRMRIWSTRMPEGIYRVMRFPITMSISRTDTAFRRAFYKGILQQLLSNTSGQLVTVVPFSTVAGDGVEAGVKTLDKVSGQYAVRYARALVVDSVTYALYFLPADSTGTAGGAQRRRFFDSITVKP